jgi:hypothetical protein
MLELLHSYCRDSLLTHLKEAVVNHVNFEQFHPTLLENFIPSRRRAQLRFERYERLQADNEPLSTSINFVREAALILRIQESEGQVVAKIIEGLTQAQKVRFVFEARRTIFADLERLVVPDRNLACAEQFKEQAYCVKRDYALKRIKNKSVFREAKPSRKPVSATAVVFLSQAGTYQQELSPREAVFTKPE